jgi:hypothetical protein
MRVRTGCSHVPGPRRGPLERRRPRATPPTSRAPWLASLALVALSCGMCVHGAAAQTEVPVADPVGRSARIQLCDGEPLLLGTVTTLDSASLSLRHHDAVRTVSLRDVRRLEVRSKNRGRWATIGLLTGMLTGVVVATIAGDDDMFTGLYGLFVVTPVLGLVGAPAGAILAPRSWESLPPEAIGAAGPTGCPPVPPP